jgi:hypothetical protein
MIHLLVSTDTSGHEKFYFSGHILFGRCDNSARHPLTFFSKLPWIGLTLSHETIRSDTEILRWGLIVDLKIAASSFQMNRRGGTWGSHGGEDVYVGLLGSNDVWTCRYIPAFRSNILPPSSGWEQVWKYYIQFGVRRGFKWVYLRFCRPIPHWL